MKRRMIGRLLVACGLLMLLLAAGLAGRNILESRRAGQLAADNAQALITALTAIQETQPAQTPETEDNSELQNEVSHPSLLPAASDHLDPVITVGDNEYLGLLEIPALGLAFSVSSDWSYELLKEGPCRFFGSCARNNLVVCGHNYGSHFAPLWTIDVGTDVYFTTADRNVYHYIVSNREILEPQEVDRMLGEARKDWDLTLFTCTFGAEYRCTVRCVRIDG